MSYQLLWSFSSYYLQLILFFPLWCLCLFPKKKEMHPRRACIQPVYRWTLHAFNCTWIHAWIHFRVEVRTLFLSLKLSIGCTWIYIWIFFYWAVLEEIIVLDSRLSIVGECELYLVSNKLVFIQIQLIANEMHTCGYAELQIWSFPQKWNLTPCSFWNSFSKPI